VRTLELNLLATLALATALFFLGQLIVRRSQFLQRYSIPVHRSFNHPPRRPSEA
jgi:Na+/glutamate symporter